MCRGFHPIAILALEKTFLEFNCLASRFFITSMYKESILKVNVGPWVKDEILTLKTFFVTLFHDCRIHETVQV